MQLFLQVFFFVVLSVSATFANDFKDIKKIALKKDEQKKILVKYDTYKKLFIFRWTLYKNDGLVIHRKYDGIVGQNILYLNHQNQSFRFDLKPRGADAYNVPYMLVKFKKFDFKKQKALFELFVSDKQNQIEIEYLKK